ncbi:unnamed protein product [Orchesella dallaii]|uniref:Uncharacterized protein n=1 Tax=Orchesella dallaii TaxID=48710 RepID=A0ABP1QMK9_9HEXA
MRKQYPHLYRKQKEDLLKEEKKPEEPKPKPDEAKKPEVPPEAKDEHHHHEHEHEHEHHHKTSDTPKPEEHHQHPKRPSQEHPRRPSQQQQPPPQQQRNRRNIRVSSSSSEETSYESSSEESEDDSQHKAMMKWYKQHYGSQGQGQQGQGQYPGMPGGYAPYNNPYPMGFGPMQAPPCYNPCQEQIQCGKRPPRVSVTKNTTVRRKLKKPQGLNFDFLPHDDLATEVTMTIEPDEPEPLQYAVENGIMPIICCYMPTSLAVNQQQPTSSHPSIAGYPQSSYNSNSKYGNGSSSKSKTHAGSGESYPQSGGGSIGYGYGGAPGPGVGKAFGEGSTLTNSSV